MPTFEKMNPNSLKAAVRHDLEALRQKAVDFLSDWIIIDGIIEKHPVQVKFADGAWHVMARGADSQVAYEAKADAVNAAKQIAIESSAALEVYGEKGLLEKRQNAILDIELPPMKQ
jgi:hypothetical protein